MPRVDTEDLVRHAAEVLREEVPVREEWRASVLRQAAAEPELVTWRAWRRGILGAALAAAAVVAAVLLMRSVAEPEPPVVRFVLVAPTASRVSLVGDFNRWNPAALPMRKSHDGSAWTVEVSLVPGRHVYSFMVDGDLAPDPAAPRAAEDDFGVPSSVVLVPRPGAT
jgi:predicted carbohydrate-binding protein with CBM48